MDTAKELTSRLVDALINPFLALLFAVGLLIFLWGLIQFLWGAEESGAKEDGKRHMLWGIVGMFVMVGAYAIMRVISTTVGGPAL
ncbi:MAG TPA: hypothetical protein VGP13_00115 [Candidatus Paceibacterota bacterium]|jgi:hypothetical protein|nr:hypothetical protein [Candidatus Paceibacterota bacterium]